MPTQDGKRGLAGATPRAPTRKALAHDAEANRGFYAWPSSCQNQPCASAVAMPEVFQGPAVMPEMRRGPERPCGYAVAMPEVLLSPGLHAWLSLCQTYAVAMPVVLRSPVVMPEMCQGLERPCGYGVARFSGSFLVCLADHAAFGVARSARATCSATHAQQAWCSIYTHSLAQGNLLQRSISDTQVNSAGHPCL